MQGYQLSGAIQDFTTVDDGLDWLGDGGLLFVHSDVPGVLLHATIYAVSGDDIRVTLYDVQNHAVGSFHFATVGHALGFARNYVVGSKH